METDIVEYREGSAHDSAVHKLPVLEKVTDITLKRGVLAGDDLFQWREVPFTSHS